jgi:AcrR family transcriptional regulator
VTRLGLSVCPLERDVSWMFSHARVWQESLTSEPCSKRACDALAYWITYLWHVHLIGRDFSQPLDFLPKPLDNSGFIEYSICMNGQTNTRQKRSWTHQADNRERLIAAGSTILAEKGLEATTVKEIARLAGVSPGLFHYYFATKDELLLAIVYEAGIRFGEQLMQEMRGIIAAQDFTDRAMLAVAAVTHRDPAWYRLRYELYALGLRNADFLPAVAQMLEKGRQGIATTIQHYTGMTEVQAQAVASIIHACTDGLALQHIAQPDLDLSEAYRQLQQLFVVKGS